MPNDHAAFFATLEWLVLMQRAAEMDGDLDRARRLGDRLAIIDKQMVAHGLVNREEAA